MQKNLGISILARSACIEDASKNKFKIIPIENVSMVREINVVYHKDFEHIHMLKEIAQIYYESIKTYQL